MPKYRESQSGNVIMIVLIGVILFGALMYTFMRGNKQGQGNLTAQQAKIVAQEIINYSNLVERVVTKLLSRGCSETQISFEHSPFDGSDAAYVNANSPSDFSCHVFHADGGALTEPTIPANAGVNVIYYYSSGSAISGIGDANNNDLIFAAYDINPSLCPVINELAWGFNGDTPIDNGTTGVGSYQGNLSSNGMQILTASGDPTFGKTAACIRGGSNIPNVYFYYKVLIAR